MELNQAAEISAAISKLPGMQGGGGNDSYANNSELQSVLQKYAKPHLSQALDLVFHTFYKDNPAARLQLPVLRVADLGCAHGQNTLNYARFIVEGMQKRLKDMPHDTICSSSPHHCYEMQYFFSDLPGNDFNALFQSLPPAGLLGPHILSSSSSDDDDNINHLPAMNVFAAGVPGSFHGQLFPKGSLHLAISTLCLHWLSQVPPSVVDRSSFAWNGGRIWIDAERPEVVEAFAQQSEVDVRAFLKSRVEELVKGGILFLFLVTRRHDKYPTPTEYSSSVKPDDHTLWIGQFESAWQDLVFQGLISEEERDMFNMPVYHSHKRELEAIFEDFKDDFEVVKVDVMKDCEFLPDLLVHEMAQNQEALANFWVGMIVGAMKPLMVSHLGEKRANELFKRLQCILTKRVSPTTLPTTFDTIIVTLRRC